MTTLANMARVVYKQDSINYISIQYNYLNLPGKITQSSKIMDYSYTADGVKVRKVFGTETTDYLDGFQYTDSVLKFFPTTEGYFNVETGKYVYNYTDYLGNTRLSYTKNGAGTEIIEESNYYPFGLKHEGYNGLTGNPSYQYKYNGKELQETGMYDYGARMYMADIGRWGVVDPLAEANRAWSPYRYAYNNPMRFIDPDGRLEDWYENDETGDIAWHDGSAKRVGETNLTKKAGDASIAVLEKSDGNIITTNMLNNDGSITRNGETITNGYSTTTVAGRTITSRNQWESIVNASGSGSPGFWHSDFARNLVNDSYNVGLSSNVAAFLGVGTTPVNFTFLTRGEPGLYFTPSVGASAGTGIEGSAGITFGGGRYTGDSRNITSSMLQGHSFGVSAGLGAIVDGSAGVSYAPVDPKNPIKGGGFINYSVQIGAGIEGSPATGVNVQLNYQYTPIVKPIFQFK
ncbi:hypothetical protein DBR28_05930 [Chryseobacterium sp. HMWF028]|nr:hypothetical protein DBR28_05930 [Chryseobacterium sp. HMWF028]